VTEPLTAIIVCPADDPLHLLADSVGGGRVPAYRQVGPGGIWVPGRAIAHNQPEALVLSLNGTVDEIGMGRALTVASTLYKLPLLTRDPEHVAHFLVARAPTYRLALVNAEGREVS
jgi:hypothetical protein